MTALIALLALSTYAPPANPFEMTRTIEPAPVLAAADEPKRGAFSYSFIEANYKWTDIDGFGDSLDGWEARVSFELPLNIFLQASYGQLSGDVDVDEWRFGAGWHIALGDTFDLYGILSATGTDIEDDNSDGLAAEVGGRVMLQKIELNARGIWVDIDDSDAGLGVGGRFYFNPKVSFGLNADVTGDATTYTAGLRFQF